MFRFDKAALRGLPKSFIEERRVRFQEVDAAGIIFYPRVLEYFHDIYVSFLERHGSPLDQVLRERRFAAPIRHAEADYLRPMRFGDVVVTALVGAELADSEVTLGYRIELARSGEIVATGQTVHVFVDPESFRRCAIPGNLRKAFASLNPESFPDPAG